MSDTQPQIDCKTVVAVVIMIIIVTVVYEFYKQHFVFSSNLEASLTIAYHYSNVMGNVSTCR